MQHRIEIFICVLVLIQAIDCALCVIKAICHCKGFQNISRALETPELLNKFESNQQRLVVYQFFMFPIITAWLCYSIPQGLIIIRSLVINQ